MIAGVLPVEEVIFFSLTTALIVCGMTLMLAPESLPRAQAWWKAALASWRGHRAYHDCP
ncbi:MAG: hypothetical protein KatS3mg051_1147 [Anaerolineae bacterium]|nr:MAG: hypothetical protein KatS3mg051_1147 [Anaerolineae bacterium]